MSIRAKRSASRPDEFLNGVPNTDLSDEEYQALTTEQRADVRNSGLWDVKTEAEASGRTVTTTAKAAPADNGGTA